VRGAICPPWSANLHVLTKCKRSEEREFYLRMATAQRWSVREVAHQIDGALFERAVLSSPKVSTVLREIHPGAEAIFRDAYFVEFLGLPDDHDEADLHAGLVQNMRRFLTELGRDFCFIGSEVALQVGGRDFILDLLFFHRELACLVAVELKVGEFMPEHLGKLEFYLEALDRDVRKPHERPSIGVLLCASKESEVVEYALSRSLSTVYEEKKLTVGLARAQADDLAACHRRRRTRRRRSTRTKWPRFRQFLPERGKVPFTRYSADPPYEWHGANAFARGAKDGAGYCGADHIRSWPVGDRTVECRARRNHGSTGTN
jgi:predicted nuclease of restriction endonuclease-like (RecB) superfamily